MIYLHLHSAVSAGEPLNQKVIETFKKHFNIEVRDGYGQTENTLLVGVTKGMEVRPGSMGKPTPGNQWKLLMIDGNPCAAGEVGDIAVHKIHLLYLKNILKIQSEQLCNSVVIII